MGAECRAEGEEGEEAEEEEEEGGGARAEGEEEERGGAEAKGGGGGGRLRHSPSCRSPAAGARHRTRGERDAARQVVHTSTWMCGCVDGCFSRRRR